MFDFKANAELVTLDKVPEEFRPLYKETPDGFALNAEDTAIGGAIKALTGMSGALSASREAERKAKAAQVDLSGLSEFGTDVDSIRETVVGLQEQLKEAIAGKAPNVDVEKIKGDLAKAHAAELAKRDSSNETLKTQLHGVLVDSALLGAINQHGGNAALLKPMLSQHIKPFFAEDGTMSVAVVDAAGDRRYSGVTGEPMTMAELVAEVKSDTQFAGAFASAAPSGSGLKPGSSTAPKTTPQAKDSVSSISAGLKKLSKS